MIDLVLDIPEFGWRINFHFAVTCYHTDTIIRELRELDCPQIYLKSAYDLISGCNTNRGVTYSNSDRRESIIVVGATTSAAEFQNSLQHEIRHCVDDIIIANKDYDKEEYAYLTGDINKRIFPYIKSLLCDGCRKSIFN